MSEIYIKEDAGLHLDRANKLLAGIGNGSFKVEKKDGTLSAGNCCVGRFKLRRSDGR